MISVENLHKWIAFGALMLVGIDVISTLTGILLLLWFLLCEAWDINENTGE